MVGYLWMNPMNAISGRWMVLEFKKIKVYVKNKGILAMSHHEWFASVHVSLLSKYFAYP
jgi:hypothetical protein